MPMVNSKRLRLWLTASSLPFPYNFIEDKHVESSLVPRLDEGSIPSSSTVRLGYQTSAGLSPGFTPEDVKPGIFFATRRDAIGVWERTYVRQNLSKTILMIERYLQIHPL